MHDTSQSDDNVRVHQILPRKKKQSHLSTNMLRNHVETINLCYASLESKMRLKL